MDNIGKAWREAKKFVAKHFPQYKNEIDLFDAVVMEGLYIPTAGAYIDGKFVILHPLASRLSNPSSLEIILHSYPKLVESLKRNIYQQLGIQVREEVVRDLEKVIDSYRLFIDLVHELAHLVDAIGKSNEEFSFRKKKEIILIRENSISYDILYYNETETNPQFKKSYYPFYILRSLDMSKKIGGLFKARLYLSKNIENFLRKICNIEYFSIGMETIFVEEKFGINKNKYLEYILFEELAKNISNIIIPLASSQQMINIAYRSIKKIIEFGLPYFVSKVYLMKNPFDPSIREKRFEERIPKSFFEEYSYKYFRILEGVVKEDLLDVLEYITGNKVILLYS